MNADYPYSGQQHGDPDRHETQMEWRHQGKLVEIYESIDDGREVVETKCSYSRVSDKGSDNRCQGLTWTNKGWICQNQGLV